MKIEGSHRIFQSSFAISTGNRNEAAHSCLSVSHKLVDAALGQHLVIDKTPYAICAPPVLEPQQNLSALATNLYA